ncbi:SCO7613 C-terminal domain-containing membrane protein [Cellulosimicrobium sp. Marseille-Q8652]
MREPWVDVALARLPDTRSCPACAAPLRSTRCDRCRLDLVGPLAFAVDGASREAADALGRRQDALDALRAAQPDAAAWARAADRQRAAAPPGVYQVGSSPGPARSGTRSLAGPPTPMRPLDPSGRGAAPLPPRTGPAPSPSRGRPVVPTAGAVRSTAPTRGTGASGGVGLQPVLAAAGAGLLAVSVVVFVFFTFGDALALRAVATGVVTVLTLAAAVLLRRTGLRSSAEAVAALAVVLALVDAELALQAGLLTGADPLLARALALGGTVVVLGVVGDRARVRAWVTSAVVLAPVVPLLAAGVEPSAWSWVLGLLAASLVSSTTGVVARRTGPRLGSALAPERRLSQVVRSVLFPLAVLVSLTALDTPGTPGRLTASGLVLVCALVGVALRLVTHERAWLAATGVTAVLAAGLLGVSDDLLRLGLVPACAALGWLALVAGSEPRVTTALRGGTPLATRSRSDLLLGGGATVLLLGTGALLGLPARVLDVVAGAAGGPVARLGTTALGSDAWWTPSADGAASTSWAGPLVTGVHVGVLALLVVALVAGRLALGSPSVLAAATPGSPAIPGTAAGRVRTDSPVTTGGRATAPWFALALVLGLVLDPRLAGVSSLVLLAVVAALLLVACTRRRVATAGGEVARWRTVGVVGVFAATGLLLVGSWTSRPTATVGAVAVGALLLAARATVPRSTHAALVATAYAYGLVVLGVTLGWAGLSGVAALCTVSAVASVVALATTLVRHVGRDTWWAVLAVTAVPFVVGVATVATERSWWSVVACVAMLALEVVLVVTRRAGTAPGLRLAGAGLALPTASVAVVSAGAMLVPGSGSPVVLPVVAALVAAVAAAARGVDRAVVARAGDAHGVRTVLEGSAALTGAITVGLAYARPAAGPDVAVAVLLLLAVGAALVARTPDRTATWWLMGALSTVAVWTALADAGVGLVEAYTAPPGLAALVVGVLLARRGRRGWDLATAGGALLVAPSLLVLVARPGAGDVRATALVAAAGLLVVGAAALVSRRRPAPAWARPAVFRLCGLAVLAASAGTVESLHVAHLQGGGALFVLGSAWALAGGACAAGAGLLAARGAPRSWRGRVRAWAAAPALVLAVAGVVANVRPVWGSIAAVWAVEVLLLVLVVVGVRRALRGLGDLPPAWFTWLLALVAAIGAWSPRELRVEVFSLPLGAGLLVAGYLAFVATSTPALSSGAAPSGPGRADGGPGAATGAGRRAWPLGRVGSWALLAPGILATLGPSVLATYTDARTWRAMLVVVIALAAVLVGTRKHLAAPFLLGVAVLPVEILVVFVSQLGTRISAGPWMLTLAAAGGLLLIIATYYERRIAAYDGAAAYVRDLR